MSFFWAHKDVMFYNTWCYEVQYVKTAHICMHTDCLPWNYPDFQGRSQCNKQCDMVYMENWWEQGIEDTVIII